MPHALRGMWAAGLEEVKVMRGLVWCFGFRVCQLDSKGLLFRLALLDGVRSKALERMPNLQKIAQEQPSACSNLKPLQSLQHLRGPAWHYLQQRKERISVGTPFDAKLED